MAGNGFEISFYNDETGQWEVTPAPSAKPLAVRKKKAVQAKEPSAGDYLNTLGDVLFVNPRNSAAATLGGAAYDYAVKSTPRSVVRDITESAEDAGDWLRKEGKLIRAAPITESLRLLKAGFIDPLADPYRVFKQAATERARGNESGGKKLAAMVPLAVAGVLPQARGASKAATKAGVEAAETAATKAATKKATKASELTVTPKTKSKPPSLLSAVRVGGKTYTGPTHLDALDAIPDPKVRSQASLDANSRGFVNERGKYMDRFKAADYARNFDLFSPDAPDWAKTAPEVISENLRLPEIAVKATKKAAPVVKGIANPIHEVALEFGSDVARRLEGMIPSDAPLSEWRAAAQGIAGSDIPNASMPAPRPYSVRPADVAVDPRIESRKGELGKIADLKVELAPRVTDPAPEVSIFDYEGHPYITSMSDLAAAGDDITAINDVRFRVPFSRRGGQDYMFDNPGSVWASERGPAERHVELADQLQQMTGKDVLYMPWTMGPNAVKFSHMPRGIQYSYADAALDGADRNALASEIKSILPNWRGFEDPDSAEMFMTVTGKARGALNTVMDKYRNRGGLGGGEAVYAATDLDQMNTPLTTLRNVGIIDPRFGASPSSHASYNYSIPGRGVGRLKENIGALGLSPDVMAALNYETPFDFPVGVQPGTKSPLRAMQMKPQGGVLDYDTLRFLEGLLEKDKK
jgi:hypothetical protein